MSEHYDVIIVGAGVVGLSLAAALDHLPIRIAILEASEFKKNGAKMHSRVSAYNLASKQFFSDIDVWQKIPEDALSDFQKITVWDGSGDGEVNFSCTDIARSSLGYIIQNEIIVEKLLEKIHSQKNVHLFCPAQPVSVDVEVDEVTVNLSDKIVSAKLIVGADGANSWLRQYFSVPVHQYSYESSALICNVQTELPHEKTARQIFLNTGPLAFLPLKKANGCSIVWSTTSDEASRLQSIKAEDFCVELSQAFQNKLGAVTQRLDLPLIFPLHMRHIKNYVSPRLAFIGDAAHTLHPLAGQGINLGLKDTRELASVIKNTLQKNRDIGKLQNLRPYERARKGENQIMISAMQGFKTLFGSDLPLVKSVRNKGLYITNASRLLKQQFMHYSTE